MTLAEYARGVGLLTLAVGSAVVSARQLRRLLVPAWAGAPAWLVDAVLTLCALLTASSALGAVGQFRVWPLAGSLAGLAVLTWSVARWCGTRRLTGNALERPVVSRTEGWVTTLTVALVAAMWSTWVAHTAQFGQSNSDSLWYHLPIAARFFQTGWLTRPHFVNAEPLTTYYPVNASVLHAVGFLAFRNDVLTPLINAALLPLTLLAGYCIGRQRGVGPSSLIGTAIVLAWPVLTVSQPGTAKDDLLSLFFLLAAVAFLFTPRGGLGAVVLSGLAAGEAIGTKLTMLFPVAAIMLMLLVYRTRLPKRTVAAWLGGTVAAGSFWYVRNAVLVGNPLPGLRLGIGRFRLPSPTLFSPRYGGAISRYAANPQIWRLVFGPGVRASFGPLWFVVLALAAAGLVLALFEAGLARVAGMSGITAAVAYLFTPGTAWAANLSSDPSMRSFAVGLFSFNLRYLAPGLAIGLALLPRARVLGGPAVRWCVLGAFASVLLVTQWTALHQPWPAAFSWAPGHQYVALTVTAAVFVTAAIVAWRRNRPLRGIVASLLVVAVVAGWFFQRYDLSNRYKSTPLYSWAASVHNARIGFTGFASQWPLYGTDLSNYVQYIGAPEPHGGFGPAASCAGFRQLLGEGRYDFVMVPRGETLVDLGFDLGRWLETETPGEPPETDWLATDPGAVEVVHENGVSVYGLARSVASTTSGCPPAPPRRAAAL